MSELDRIHKLADELTLALRHQREVNEILVTALDATSRALQGRIHYGSCRSWWNNDGASCDCSVRELREQVRAALAAAHEVK